MDDFSNPAKEPMSADTNDQDFVEDDGYDYLVEAAYEALAESGFADVRVSGYEDLPGPEPLAGSGIIPDLTAMNRKGMLFLFEICPREAFALAELAERLLALAAYAEAQGAQVVLIVPEGEADLAGAFLAEHAIPENRLTVWEA